MQTHPQNIPLIMVIFFLNLKLINYCVWNEANSFEYYITCVHVYCMVLWGLYENKLILLFLNQTFHLQLSNRKGT